MDDARDPRGDLCPLAISSWAPLLRGRRTDPALQGELSSIRVDFHPASKHAKKEKKTEKKKKKKASASAIVDGVNKLAAKVSVASRSGDVISESKSASAISVDYTAPLAELRIRCAFDRFS